MQPPTSSNAQTPAQSPNLPTGIGGLLPEPELQIESNTQLNIFEGAAYKLAADKIYFLQAPLGYTVGYRIEDGSLILYRDGRDPLWLHNQSLQDVRANLEILCHSVLTHRRIASCLRPTRGRIGAL